MYSTESAIRVKNNCQVIKILVLGDKGVGKTSLILKYAKNDFDIHNKPTVSYAYHLCVMCVLTSCHLRCGPAKPDKMLHGFGLMMFYGKNEGNSVKCSFTINLRITHHTPASMACTKSLLYNL